MTPVASVACDCHLMADPAPASSASASGSQRYLLEWAIYTSQSSQESCRTLGQPGLSLNEFEHSLIICRRTTTASRRAMTLAVAHAAQLRVQGEQRLEAGDSAIARKVQLRLRPERHCFTIEYKAHTLLKCSILEKFNP